MAVILTSLPNFQVYLASQFLRKSPRFHDMFYMRMDLSANIQANLSILADIVIGKSDMITLIHGGYFTFVN
jgi:hypothetical protein